MQVVEVGAADEVASVGADVRVGPEYGGGADAQNALLPGVDEVFVFVPVSAHTMHPRSMRTLPATSYTSTTARQWIVQP